MNQVCIPLLAFEVDPGELDRVEGVFSEQAVVVLNGHRQYRSRIIKNPDGHAIEFYAVQYFLNVEFPRNFFDQI